MRPVQKRGLFTWADEKRVDVLTVRDLLTAPVLADARSVIEGEVGFDEVVTGFGTFDVEALLDRYHTFRPDEVIATALSFSGGDEKKASEGLVSQMDSGVAAIFIKDMLFSDVSEDVKAKARETNTPIFFFKQAYMEDMVTEIRTMFLNDQEEERRRIIINDLMKAREVRERRRLFRDTTGLAGSCVACAAFRPDHAVDSLTKRAITSTLNDEAERESDLGCFICQYEHSWVLLAVSDDVLSNMDAQMPDLCEKLMDASGIPLRCGLGDAVLLEDVDMSITQALQAVEKSSAQDALCRWRDSGWIAFAGAAKASPLFSRQNAYVRGILSDYDAAHDSNLLETVRSFVRCGGVVQKTADELYLHPNSVRNRVVRAANLLGMEGESERALFAYFAIMFLDEEE